MTPDELFDTLFPLGHRISVEGGAILGSAQFPDGRAGEVIGVAEGTPIGLELALVLAARILEICRRGDRGDRAAILVLLDSGSQRMARHEELFGLNEYLAHLSKCLLMAEALGHRTIGLLYGRAAAGAFIATALSCGTLIALPEAEPMVMDLPSMSRVTKLSLATLTEMALSTPIFAPGVANLERIGAIDAILESGKPLDRQLAAILATQPAAADTRDRRGADRGGRCRAELVAQRVAAALGHG